VGLGEEDYMGPFLVVDLACYNFMGSFFESLVVGIYADNAYVAVKNPLYLVD
jgi:hypothetical protein